MVLQISLRNSDAKCVGNKMPRRFQNFPVCLGNTLPMTQQKPLYITSGIASAYLGILSRAMICFFKQLRLLVLPKLYLFTYNTHLNVQSGRQYCFHLSPCFCFFVCPCYSRITRYSPIEKLGAQNIVVCENQGRQHKLSDH